MVKIGINGFDGFGKILVRLAASKENLIVTRINQPSADINYMKNFLRYDSIYGRFSGRIEEKEGCLVVGNSFIKISGEEKIENADWSDCDIVIDGICHEPAEAYRGLLKKGVKKIITKSHESENVLFGIRSSKEQIISLATPESSGAAVIIKPISDAFGVESGIITTLTALDDCSCGVEKYSCEKWRNGRPSYSVIPSLCGAAQSVGRLLPEFKDVFSGISLKIPSRAVSTLNMTLLLKNTTDYSSVQSVLKEAAEGKYRGMLGVTEDSVVSEDFVGCPLYAVVDLRAGLLQGGKLLSLTAWYDGVWSSANGLLRLIEDI